MRILSINSQIKGTLISFLIYWHKDFVCKIDKKKMAMFLRGIEFMIKKNCCFLESTLKVSIEEGFVSLNGLDASKIAP